MSDIVLRNNAMDILVRELGAVNAERFIFTIKKESFDYTKWQKTLWVDKSIDEVYELAAKRESVNILAKRQLLKPSNKSASRFLP